MGARPVLPNGPSWSGEGNMSCRNSCSAREQYLHTSQVGQTTRSSDSAVSCVGSARKLGL